MLAAKFKLSNCYYCTRTRFTVSALATWLNCRDMLNNRAIRNILIRYAPLDLDTFVFFFKIDETIRDIYF